MPNPCLRRGTIEWRNKYGSMSKEEAKRLKELEKDCVACPTKMRVVALGLNRASIRYNCIVREDWNVPPEAGMKQIWSRGLWSAGYIDHSSGSKTCRSVYTAAMDTGG